MQHAIDISEIKSRAERIGLHVKALAEEAGVDVSTVYRAVQGADMRVSTARQLTAVLVRRERELLAYLQALHPDGEVSSEAAE